MLPSVGRRADRVVLVRDRSLLRGWCVAFFCGGLFGRQILVFLFIGMFIGCEGLGMFTFTIRCPALQVDPALRGWPVSGWLRGTWCQPGFFCTEDAEGARVAETRV